MKAQLFGLTLLGLLVVFISQNCGKSTDLVAKSFQDYGAATLGSGGELPPPPPPPPPGGGNEGQVFANYAACAADSNVDACIFRKNPTAFNNGPVTPAPSYTRNYNDLQRFGVKIQNRLPGNFLDNTLFSVVVNNTTNPLITQQGTLNTQVLQAAGQNRLQPVNGKWLFPYSQNGAADAQHRVAQVMGYYYLEQQRQAMIQKVGNFWVSDGNERVLMFAFEGGTQNNAFAGPLGGNLPLDVNGDGTAENFQSIIGMGFFTNLSPGAGTSEAALSAEIYLHEMGHRNFGNAGTGGSGNPPNTIEGTCTGGQGTCCRSAAGCVGGIHEGQADFHLVFVFPDTVNASVGETTVNNLAGLPACVVNGQITRTRNMSANSAMTANEAFNNCGGNGQTNGEVHDMGTLYASLWFEIWRNAPQARRNQIERVFNEHLRQLQPNHNFRNGLEIARTIDAQMFNGANVALFNGQMGRLAP